MGWWGSSGCSVIIIITCTERDLLSHAKDSPVLSSKSVHKTFRNLVPVSRRTVAHCYIFSVSRSARMCLILWEIFPQPTESQAVFTVSVSLGSQTPEYTWILARCKIKCDVEEKDSHNCCSAFQSMQNISSWKINLEPSRGTAHIGNADFMPYTGIKESIGFFLMQDKMPQSAADTHKKVQNVIFTWGQTWFHPELMLTGGHLLSIWNQIFSVHKSGSNSRIFRPWWLKLEDFLVNEIELKGNIQVENTDLYLKRNERIFTVFINMSWVLGARKCSHMELFYEIRWQPKQPNLPRVRQIL